MPKKQKRRIKTGVYAESFNTKDQGDSKRPGIFDFKKAGYKEISFYKPKEGKNKIAIIPYEIKSKNHPLVKSGKLEVGDLTYVLDIHVHKYVGAADADIVCPKENFGKPCPICDMAKAMYNSKDKEEQDQAKHLRAKRRAVYNVLPYENGELSDQLKIWDVSHFLFEKELIEEARSCSDGEDIIPFADIEDGSDIKFRMSIDKNGQYETPKFKSFDFYDRDEELEEELIDEAVSFDKALVILSPDEILALYHGEDGDIDEEEEEEEKSKKAKRSSKKKTPEPEEEDEEEEEEESPKKARSRRKVTKEEEEDEEESPRRSRQSRKKIEDEEEEEEEESPRKSRRSRRKAAEDEDEEEEEEKPRRSARRKKAVVEEEEEEEEESPKKSTQKKTGGTTSRSKKKTPEPEEEEEGTCPSGHAFGKDCDKYKKDCNRCSIWDECMEASEE